MQRDAEIGTPETPREKHEKISKVLTEFRGLKEIAAIKGMTKQQRIKSLLNTDGAEVTEKQALTDVFAKFYEELYVSRVENHTCPRRVARVTEEPFTHRELQDALNLMRKG